MNLTKGVEQKGRRKWRHEMYLLTGEAYGQKPMVIPCQALNFKEGQTTITKVSRVVIGTQLEAVRSI